jgi:hypothetical protein
VIEYFLESCGDDGGCFNEYEYKGKFESGDGESDDYFVGDEDWIVCEFEFEFWGCFVGREYYDEGQRR